MNKSLIFISCSWRNLAASVRFASSRSSTFNIKEENQHNVKDDVSPTNETLKENSPIQMENPFKKEKQLCLLCKYQITPDYKNTRLLSQFMSRFTGNIYGRHITGLCKQQQRNVEIEIRKAQGAGLMPSYYRLPQYSHDPKLFDPDNPFRAHRF